jgi:Kef-type K+ transport system membrane component KefB
MFDLPVAFLLTSDSDSTRVLVAMLTVFGSAKILAEVFEKLRQPGIVGEILAGVLVGPHVLGWIEPTNFLRALSELGVMFLLFRVGLEVHFDELVKVGKTSLAAAVLGVLAPLGMGWGILRLWGAGTAEALFVGAAMVATSVGITAQVLAAKGLLNHIASRIILTAAVIDDVLGLIVLAMVNSVAHGNVKVLDLAFAAVLAVGFTSVVAFFGTKAVSRVVPKMGEKLNAGEVEFNLAMVFLFALSLLAVRSGVAAIIGAFLAGMALAPTVSHRVHDLTQGVASLLTPFFLAGIGLQLQTSVFRDASTLWLTAVILAAAILSKIVGCGVGALPAGWRNAVRVGCGMVPRGEVGMVVAQIGMSAGVVSPQVYGVVVAMAVLTTMVAPILLKLSYRGAQADLAGDG